MGFTKVTSSNISTKQSFNRLGAASSSTAINSALTVDYLVVAGGAGGSLGGGGAGGLRSTVSITGG